MSKTAVLDDGSHAVVRTDPAKPRFLEVIAIFYDVSRLGGWLVSVLIVFALMPLVPIPLLAQTSAQQPMEQPPSQSINYQICTFVMNLKTGEATSICSSVYKCTSIEKLSKLSTHRELEEMDNVRLLKTVSADMGMRI